MGTCSSLVLHRPLRCYRAVLTLTPRRVTAVFPKHPDVAAHQRHWTVQDFEAREQLLEERERKEKKKSTRKVKAEGSGDEAAAEPKKKRRGKLKKANGVAGDGEEALFSDGEERDKPARKVGFVCLFACLLLMTMDTAEQEACREGRR